MIEEQKEVGVGKQGGSDPALTTTNFDLCSIAVVSCTSYQNIFIKKAT